MNRTQNYVKQTRIEAPADTVFAWHAAPGALERLMPPWESTRILERSGKITDGRVVLDVRTGPIRQRWVAEHGPLTDGLGFRDVQVEGPFHRFEHIHRMIPEGSTTHPSWRIGSTTRSRSARRARWSEVAS